MLAGVVLAAPLAAQRGTLGGQVVRGRGGGTEPLSNQWVVLHRVDQESGAPLDSMRTDGQGRYRFRLTWDTTSIYFVGTEWQSIAYLTQPVEGRTRPDTAETLVVWDTTRAGPPLAVAQRHIIVRRPEADVGRRVLELVVLQNRGHATRVGTGPSGPVWTARLPEGAFRFEMGESDMSAEAVRAFEGDVQVMAPVPPGERQLLYTYLLPGNRDELEVRFQQASERVTILLEDTTSTLVEGQLADRGVEVFEDATFRIYDGPVVAGSVVRISFGAGFRMGEGAMTALVVVALVSLGAMIVILRRRRGTPTADPQVVARQIAALDAAFERQADPPARARREYEEARARLKAELDRLLANPETPRG